MRGKPPPRRPPVLGPGVRALAITAAVSVVVVAVLALVKGVVPPPPPTLPGAGSVIVTSSGRQAAGGSNQPAIVLAKGPSIAEVVARRQARQAVPIIEGETPSRTRRGRSGRVPRIAPAPAPETPGPIISDDGDDARINALVGQALAGPPPEVAPAAPAPSAPPELGREEIDTVMKSVAAQIRASCRSGRRATATVRVEVGPAGEVSSARVQGPLAGTPAGGCVEQAITTARFPASAGTSFRYAFHVR